MARKLLPTRGPCMTKPVVSQLRLGAAKMSVHTLSVAMCQLPHLAPALLEAKPRVCAPTDSIVLGRFLQPLEVEIA